MMHLFIWRLVRSKPAKMRASLPSRTCRWRSVTRTALAPALVFVSLLLAFSSATYADDALALEQYLARLGLTDLRLHHLERTLERTTDAKQRAAYARLLADAYADQMLAAADDEGRFDQL